MPTCEHKCTKCGEQWVCDFPYFSNHDYFEEAVQTGSYCNSYCPNCNVEEREEIKNLFEAGKRRYLNPDYKLKKSKEKIKEHN